MIVNPFTRFDVSRGWSTAHPAIDYKTPIGFEFTSPADGSYHRMPDQLTWAPGQAGVWGKIRLEDGSVITVCHLDRHLAADGARVRAGVTPVGVTGNTGYVIPAPSRANPHAGAHMHTSGFTPTGARWNWTLDVSAPAGGGSEPLPTPSKKRTPDMLLAHIPNKAGTGRHEYLIFGPQGAVMRFTGETAARAFEKQIGAVSAPVGQSFFNDLLELAGGVQKFELTNADEVGGVTLNVTKA